ncbi:hypothetical protein F2Q70_00004794 [Brassica cretica]|uniref:Uncharacterized protein n=1 Tax=Brassica cretica TaxID=69181 RepID=A0A8S9IPC4_BRACR|nr:hypothetical protein F2Q70_00004794 [Brassica cretica]
MGIASKGPRIVLRELRRGCTVSGREVGPRPWARIDRELVFRELSGIDSVVTRFDLNTVEAQEQIPRVLDCFYSSN